MCLPLVSVNAVYYEQNLDYLRDFGISGGYFVYGDIYDNSGVFPETLGACVILFPYNGITGLAYDGSYNIININNTTVNVRVFSYDTGDTYYGRFSSFSGLEVRPNSSPYTYRSFVIGTIYDMNFNLLGDDYSFINNSNMNWSENDNFYLFLCLIICTLVNCLVVIICRNRK